jgi:hypothetical protein
MTGFMMLGFCRRTSWLTCPYVALLNQKSCTRHEVYATAAPPAETDCGYNGSCYVPSKSQNPPARQSSSHGDSTTRTAGPCVSNSPEG